ncbi:hypothetical protein EG329_005245 [Mollisiaceae sp. DMI_Dod_QoI]|nr:hypothetical protein EG329_005245 [Helotiales sp. DMI_Dod_QoI]
MLSSLSPKLIEELMILGLVIIPTTAEEISLIVKFTQTHKIDLAVLCGGHGQRGAAQTEGGILIDLQKMRNIIVNAQEKTVSVQGGTRWNDIYPILDAHNLAIVGGICSSVGVGGYTLGGGYGWLTGRHGLALDNLLAAEMILVSGEMVRASKDENEDLFWAIRGAGACFGIVTTFVFRTHAQENLCWLANFVFNGKGEEGGKGKVIKAAIKIINKVLLQNSNGDNACCMRWRLEKDMQEPSIHVMCFHNGSEEGGKEFFKGIMSEDLRDNLVSESMTMMKVGQSGMDTPHTLGMKQILKGASHMPPIRAKFFEDLWDEYLRFLRTSGYMFSYMLWEFHNMSQVLSVGQKETAFPNRGNYGNLMCAATWEPDDGEEMCEQWSRKISHTVREELERTKGEWGENLDEDSKTTVGEYTNYDGLGEGAKFLYGINYDRLVSIKRAYDPGNVFNKFVDLLAEADR